MASKTHDVTASPTSRLRLRQRGNTAADNRPPSSTSASRGTAQEGLNTPAMVDKSPSTDARRLRLRLRRHEGLNTSGEASELPSSSRVSRGLNTGSRGSGGLNTGRHDEDVCNTSLSNLELSVGDRVIAKWITDKRWYVATIRSVSKTK